MFVSQGMASLMNSIIRLSLVPRVTFDLDSCYNLSGSSLVSVDDFQSRCLNTNDSPMKTFLQAFTIQSIGGLSRCLYLVVCVSVVVYVRDEFSLT